MAGLGSMMPSLGLLLCLGMLFTSASSANSSDHCMLFSTVISTTASVIQANSKVYESNKVYTILVPIDYRTISVVLRALDTSNNSIGRWYQADQTCNSSALYLVKDPHDRFFKANWESPHSMNITTVEIQAFAVNVDKVATFSYLKLNKQAISTPSYFVISTNRPSTTRISATTQIPTTIRILKPTSTLTTTKSLANRIFLSPITDAIQILLVFLTSKLLF